MEHLRKFNDNYVGDYEFNDEEEEINYGIWETESGKEIKVSEMTLKHLKSTLNAIINFAITFKSEKIRNEWARTLLNQILEISME